jgi:hypothetical protein
MLTEVDTTSFAVKINGVVVIPNLPSRMVAENLISSLPPAQRAVAEVVTMTKDGKTLLFG